MLHENPVVGVPINIADVISNLDPEICNPKTIKTINRFGEAIIFF